MPKPPENLIKVRGLGHEFFRREDDLWQIYEKGSAWSWDRLLGDFGPLTAVEYKKEPPNEYDLLRYALDLHSEYEQDKIDQHYHSQLEDVRGWIDSFKKHYGIED
jgi:hypothetical protein